MGIFSWLRRGREERGETLTPAERKARGLSLWFVWYGHEPLGTLAKSYAETFLRDLDRFMTLRREQLDQDRQGRAGSQPSPEALRALLSTEVALLLLHLRRFLSNKNVSNNEKAEHELFARVLDVVMSQSLSFPFNPDLALLMFGLFQTEWLKAGKPSAITDVALHAYSSHEVEMWRPFIARAGPFVEGLMSYFQESKEY